MSWKQTTLGEIVNLKRGFDLPASKRIEGPYPIYSSSGQTGTHNEAAANGPCVITGRYGTIGQVFFLGQILLAVEHIPILDGLQRERSSICLLSAQDDSLAGIHNRQCCARGKSQSRSPVPGLRSGLQNTDRHSLCSWRARRADSRQH